VLIALSTFSGFMTPANDDGVVADENDVLDKLGLVGAGPTMKSHAI
jgi:hypothetical protein